MKFNLLSHFDVWGNETDGFEVNDSMVVKKDIDLPVSDSEILDWLKLNNYLGKSANLDNIGFSQDSDTYIEVYEEANGYPLFSFIAA